MQTIILKNGNEITLAEWQLQQGLPPELVSQTMGIDMFYYNSDGTKFYPFRHFKISVYILEIMDALANEGYKKINSLFRSDDKQKDLYEYQMKELKKNPKYIVTAAQWSPHSVGMAVDIDTISTEDTYNLVKQIQECSTQLGISVRIGYSKYLLKGQTFVHLDACPMYYGLGKVYNGRNHPKQWESSIKW